MDSSFRLSNHRIHNSFTITMHQTNLKIVAILLLYDGNICDKNITANKHVPIVVLATKNATNHNFNAG